MTSPDDPEDRVRRLEAERYEALLERDADRMILKALAAKLGSKPDISLIQAADELLASQEVLRRQLDEARAERQRAIDDALATSDAWWSTQYGTLQQERDELKARLAHAEADAEQAIHNEAFTERQRVISYIRARLAHATMDDRVSMRERGVMIDLANAIERGESER